MMILMGRTREKSFLNGYQGEDWAVVKECIKYTPSGKRAYVQFPSGYQAKAELCELVYVFNK